MENNSFSVEAVGSDGISTGRATNLPYRISSLKTGKKILVSNNVSCLGNGAVPISGGGLLIEGYDPIGDKRDLVRVTNNTLPRFYPSSNAGSSSNLIVQNNAFTRAGLVVPAEYDKKIVSGNAGPF